MTKAASLSSPREIARGFSQDTALKPIPRQSAGWTQGFLGAVLQGCSASRRLVQWWAQPKSNKPQPLETGALTALSAPALPYLQRPCLNPQGGWPFSNQHPSSTGRWGCGRAAPGSGPCWVLPDTGAPLSAFLHSPLLKTSKGGCNVPRGTKANNNSVCFKVSKTVDLKFSL